MFALGAEDSNDKEKYMKLAADITHTCHESYDRTGTSIIKTSFIEHHLG